MMQRGTETERYSEGPRQKDTEKDREIRGWRKERRERAYCFSILNANEN